ncbi:MAG: methyltransferase domain-containing protein [Actinomycetota bacterium]
MVPDLNDPKRVIAQEYDRSADRFSESADRLVYAHLCRPLADALDRVEGAVLDVASGTGALGRRFPGCVATDLSFGQLSCNPIELRVQADAESLPFADDSFGAVGCAFGINHSPDPGAAVSEMARVAPIVGVLTWVRPEVPYAPKEAVFQVLERHAGARRTHAGCLVEEMSTSVGSASAVLSLLVGAGLDARVEVVTVEVPWPGPEAFVDYRLAMAGAFAMVDDPEGLKRDAIAAVASLGKADVGWQPRLILGLGRRRDKGGPRYDDAR